jgi:hypothetical protein
MIYNTTSSYSTFSVTLSRSWALPGGSCFPIQSFSLCLTKSIFFTIPNAGFYNFSSKTHINIDLKTTGVKSSSFKYSCCTYYLNLQFDKKIKERIDIEHCKKQSSKIKINLNHQSCLVHYYQ